ncbi:dephospho-CoA kinase [Brevibacterium linens]|uniref:Dephospho-CoA kinase n=1 Tax=Brevibacterium linens ATCC 9172 TaxID=1255617 RepID=A0A2H1HL25_BRELN|nr:dephospho-CoA kinase [Brevibacterium linens]KAB1949602.1 dephospho-CoA kinase [Brevibacterium linens ATCC 9172]SMX63576.1 dephospho-CoA kinase [Brevibacterium linens ATCC 9172]
MLRIGLTGGIGAGKSTVSAMLVEHGAVLVDSDRIAREVVEPGQPLLEKLAEAFGPQVLHSDGSLDRQALAAEAFVDSDHTARLNGLMHPAIRDRTAEHFARHADAEIVVHDVPLLVENDMTPAYHLNLLVDVPAEVRLQRLMDSRGMDRDDAAARISRQADDDTRRAACDVTIDNSGPVDETKAAVGRLIESRIRPFAANLTAGRWAPRTVLDLVDPADADWSGDAQRVVAKLRHGTADEFTVEHIGSTSVPGLPAKDVIDLQLLVPDLIAARELEPRLAELGYPGTEMSDHLGEGGTEPKWFHANTDPGRAVNLHVRTADSVGAHFARAFRDLLTEDAWERERYLQVKRELTAEAKAAGATDAQMTRTYAESKELYFLEMRRRLVPDSFD